MRPKKKTKDEILQGLDGVSAGASELKVSLGSLLGVERSPEGPPPRPQDTSPTAKIPAQVTLWRQSAGRGGKTVTVAACKPQPSERELDLLAKQLRKGLGCGSRLEDGRIVMQGDIQERARQWLQKYGVKKVVLGN